jgi:polyisoprenoid-binding protein YceI
MPLSTIRRLRHALLALSCAVLSAVAAQAAERTLILDPARSKVSFELPATGHTVRGSLAVKEGAVTFDDAAGTASGAITLDALKAQTGSSGRDEKMHAEVLLTGRFPTITLRATRIEGQVPASVEGSVKGTVKLHGSIGLIGAEHEVVLPAELEVSGDQVTGRASFDVPFVQWGLKDPSVLFLKVEKVVRVTVEVAGRLSG